MHFLSPLVARHLCRTENAQKRVACVDVRVETKGRNHTLIVMPTGVFVLKLGVEMILVPSDIPIMSDEGEVLKGDFAISAETFDPCHVLVPLEGDAYEEAFPSLHWHAKTRHEEEVVRKVLRGRK